MSVSFRRWLWWLIAFALFLPAAAPAEEKPVYIGLDAEFGHLTSTSDDAIRRGILIAIDEINRAGGVLGGRPLALVETDNRSVPARAIENLKALAGRPDLVAVFCGKFSPVVLESVPVVHSLGLPLLDPWAAADAIVDNGYQPNYVFRLSLRDGWALPVMMRHARKKGAERVGLLLPNTAWGRSSLQAAEAYAAGRARQKIVGVHWYNWGEKTLADRYRALLREGAQAVVLVANETEGSLLVREVAAMPKKDRVPIISHWGVSGGDFAALAGPALQAVDFSVVQTYSFVGTNRERARQVVTAAKRLFQVEDERHILSPVGLAHAYDLTHILALAIDRAGTTSRPAVRDALEQVKNYDGLIKHYLRPFTPSRHEALGAEDVFMARFETDGALVRVPDGGK